MSDSLNGVYHRDSLTKFSNNEFYFLILQRKNNTVRKPENYLMRFYWSDSSRKEYISSLFLNVDGQYQLEYQGQIYSISLSSSNVVTIESLS